MEENTLAKSAIQAAMDGNWQEAVKINTQILEENPQDTEALNRLAKACSELGNPKKAKECYCRVLEFDPANTIATKNLKLLTKSINGNGTNGTKNINGKNGYKQSLRPNGLKKWNLEIFLAEPGKTKLVNLVNLAPPSTLSTLACGEKTKMIFKKHQVAIENFNGEYLGAVPDDLSHYLISLIKVGNNYEAYIKAVKTNTLTVLIWETQRSTKLANQPSFLTRQQTKVVKSLSSETSMTDSDLEENLFEFSEA